MFLQSQLNLQVRAAHLAHSVGRPHTCGAVAGARCFAMVHASSLSHTQHPAVRCIRWSARCAAGSASTSSLRCLPPSCSPAAAGRHLWHAARGAPSRRASGRGHSDGERCMAVRLHGWFAACMACAPPSWLAPPAHHEGSHCTMPALQPLCSLAGWRLTSSSCGAAGRATQRSGPPLQASFQSSGDPGWQPWAQGQRALTCGACAAATTFPLAVAGPSCTQAAAAAQFCCPSGTRCLLHPAGRCSKRRRMQPASAARNASCSFIAAGIKAGMAACTVFHAAMGPTHLHPSC